MIESNHVPKRTLHRYTAPRDSEGYVVIGTVEGIDCSFPLKLRYPPQGHEMNVLNLLCEKVGRPIPISYLEARMGITRRHMSNTICLLRRILHPDWLILTQYGKGIRIVHMGSPLHESETTVLSVDYNIFRRRIIPLHEMLRLPELATDD